jgi:hypothetical protein
VPTPPEGLDAELVLFASLDALKAAAPGSLSDKIAYVGHAMQATQDGSSYGFSAPCGARAPVLRRSAVRSRS